ncbi:MAG: alpha-2-macroglobulin family protein [Tatlockia sp.]|nr:alpha-2-macroglobulin family protein [Tatlockia sp.]
MNPILKSIKVKLSAFLSLVFGRIRWNSPPWLTYFKRKAALKPIQFLVLTSVVIALLSAGSYGYHWYKNLPQPQLVSASITAPNITPIGDELFPDNLTIDFGLGHGDNFLSQSVAPINLIGKEVSTGIQLNPAMPGKWIWSSDSKLVFTPLPDWPAGQSYSIHFDKGVFAPTAKMASDNYYFSTVAFKAKIEEFKFYQDPVNPKIRQVVATIHFNFPVDTASLEANTSLMFQALKNNKLDLSAEKYKFTLNYDPHKRIAYLHSENLSLPEISRYLILTINKGVRSASGSALIKSELSQNLLIPDNSNYLKISVAKAAIIRNDQDRPEQLLTIETTLGVREPEINKSLHVYLLPQNYPATATEPEKTSYEWQNPGEVSANILALAKQLSMQGLASERNYANLHSYKFNAQTPQYLYLKIDKGMRGFGDFVLANDYSAIIKVPPYPREIGFIHKGALLALSSEKKLSVLLRGLSAVKFSFARVLPDNVNQLVTQTQGDFNNPYFTNQSFNQQNISEIFSEIRQFDARDQTKQQYTALDFSKYLSASANSSGPNGLFLLQASGWDIEKNQALDVNASRLILITDLGMLVKDNSDGSHDVFVQSITTGTPIANATLSILGKNGLAILTRTTDFQGRANFPTLKSYFDDREPTVYLAALGTDVSFIPYNQTSRQLNYSRFDTGGLYSSNQELNSLSAYLFSDRGIYRPGDAVHIGMIVKQAYAKPQPAGLPLEVSVIDPRGTTIKTEKFTLDPSGFLSLDFATNATSPTGQYQVNLYIVKDSHPDSFLGSTTIRVAEFQPDRLRISSSFSEKQTQGWISPTELKATVDLWNLYGAPAAFRKVSAKILLAPKPVKFASYPDYVFKDPLQDSNKPAKVFTDSLADAKTDDKGQALFNLDLDRFNKATYHLTFFAEGFEAESGRSVATQSTALVSPLPYFIGYKPDGDLAYIKQNSQRSVNLIAVNPQLKQLQVDGLMIQLLSMHPVTTLVKKADGTYQYQSIIQSKVIDSKPFTISEQGNNYNLATQQIGDFAINILDKDNNELSQLKYSVVGESHQALSKNAELNIKLNKSEYLAGEDIELQITAPYTGSGLITIERDKVYATQWFKTDSTSSVQKIHIPEDFQGNGYINVSFVRNWDSPDIFISPLSYSVAPFAVNHGNQAVQIELNAPELALPGEPFTISYKTDKPGKILVFAVDEGILQVSNYQTPDPLAFFFQKHALEVITQQTVDLILPKFVQDRELSAVGGDGGEEMIANHLNPFKRKTDLPVVYWSGIMDTDATARQVTYQLPDYFNGSLRVMAVAVATDALGSTEKQSEIRGNFIINPNTPSFVAPGDEFEITASVANNVKGSGDNAPVSLQLTSTAGLEIISEAQSNLNINEGQEKIAHFKLRATTTLGSAKLSLTASSGNKASKMNATISVRPASAFTTSVTSGKSKDRKKALPVLSSLYPEYRKVEASMSSSPLILVSGLKRYLDGFPYGCTEQLTSQAFPSLAMAGQSWFATDLQKIKDKINATIQLLGQRQRSNGSFSYWPGLGDNASNGFASVYAMQFLTEARLQNYNVPVDLFSIGLSYLRDLAGQTPSSIENARIQAYAIYVLTRNEIVTTNYLTNLQLYLDREQSQKWQEELTGSYIAATFKLLQNSPEANRLISQYKSQSSSIKENDFYDKNIADAQYLYLVARHFPEKLALVGESLVLNLVNAINSAELNTLLSSYSSLALSAYAQTNQPSTDSAFSIKEVFTDNQEKTANSSDNRYQKLSVSEKVAKIIFNNPTQQTFFYQLTQAGFDKQLPTDALKKGIEITREYRDKEGNPITSTSLGSEIDVHIQVRSLDNRYLSNIAIIDLLPGGFEVLRDSVKTENIDYADLREDRVVFFTSLDSNAKELVYRIKAINSGKYTIPPIMAESMYNPNLRANGVAGSVIVEEKS